MLASHCFLSSPSPEVLVYIGHLQAILNRPLEAVDVFNQILATPNISQKLTSLVYRKLGVCSTTCACTVWWTVCRRGCLGCVCCHGDHHVTPPFAGWLYHTCAALDAVCPTRSTKALEMLNSAVGACPSCWHAWFLLGRYHEAQGRVQEAFMALRHAISKDSTRPEVWCAIG